MVYEHLFTTLLRHQLQYLSAYPRLHDRYRLAYGGYGGKNLVNILCVCRQITAEATPVLWKKFTEACLERSADNSIDPSLPVIVRNKLPHMRSLAANVQRYAPTYKTKLVFRLIINRYSMFWYQSLKALSKLGIARQPDPEWDSVLALLRRNILLTPAQRLLMADFRLSEVRNEDDDEDREGDDDDDNVYEDNGSHVQRLRNGCELRFIKEFIVLNGPLASLDWDGSDA